MQRRRLVALPFQRLQGLLFRRKCHKTVWTVLDGGSHREAPIASTVSSSSAPHDMKLLPKAQSSPDSLAAPSSKSHWISLPLLTSSVLFHTHDLISPSFIPCFCIPSPSWPAPTLTWSVVPFTIHGAYSLSVLLVASESSPGSFLDLDLAQLT